MLELLQWLGGGCFLLNKVFLSFSERTRRANQTTTARRWRIASWIIYLVGLPPWVIIFVYKHDWIAAALEAGGTPAMCLGLLTAIRGIDKKSPRWLDVIALSSIVVGLTYSLFDFGGLKTLGQYVELSLVAGFLIGTYQLAKERVAGYLWYVLMHVSCGYLMWIQDYVWLALQQAISLIFIVDAYVVARQQSTNKFEPLG